MGKFLDPMIAKSPAYPTIISRLQRGDSLLDIGCFVGQDLRRLVFDGAPATNLFGVDIVNHWDVGYELFRDNAKFSAKFIETDILNPNEDLKALTGKMDIISVTHVLHQWEFEGQLAAAKQLSLYSRPGTIVIGYQVGRVEGSTLKSGEIGSSYQNMLHDLGSWKEMWHKVGEATGTKWTSDTKLRTWKECGYNPEETAYLGENSGLLEFVVARIR
jgi:SAM-dependent methyltransferase